jgi:thiol-disulfide isomerase/thioredoxin
LLLVAILAGCSPTGLSSNWERIDPPRAAPDFTLQALSGEHIQLSSLRGRIVLMEIWATWCGPCRFSTPALDVIHRKYRDRGVTALLVNHGEEPEAIRKWAGKRFAAPILVDRQQSASALYQAYALPTLVVIDREGRMVWRHEGYGGGLEAQLKIVLEEMLAPAPAATFPQPVSDTSRAQKGVRHHG